MIAAVSTGVTQVITYTGEVIDAIAGQTGAWSNVLPLVGLAINSTSGAEK